MTEVTPALLAEFAHRVPDTPMPRGIPFLWISRAGNAFPRLNGWQDQSPHLSPGDALWTREPIRPPLPTGLGAVLRDVTTTGGHHWDVAVRCDMSDGDEWRIFDLANLNGGSFAKAGEFATWTVVSEGVEL